MDQALINQIVAARQSAGKQNVGTATFGTGASENGGATTAVESFANPTFMQELLNSHHAEPQVINLFQGAGCRTIAVDQNPCATCSLRILLVSFKSPVRVIGPSNPNSLFTGPKNSALGGANGKYAPGVQGLGNYGFKPMVVIPSPGTQNR